MSKTIATLSADASILISQLSTRKKGELITYADIQRIIGWDVREKRSILQSVRRALLRDYDIVLGTVVREGFRILEDRDIVNGKWRAERIRRRRSAQRQKREAAAVDTSLLTDADRLRALSELTTAHIVLESSADKAVARIETHLIGATTPLALNNALDALKNSVTNPSNHAAGGGQEA